jgi:carbon storage regulator CsrA
MQVISRQVNEGLVIGEEIIVTVLEILNDCVRLGISNPNNDPEYWEETLFWEHAEAACELQLH